MSYQTDSHGQITDDSDRWLSGHESTFDYDPSPDYDGMEYDDFRSGPKCGGRVYEGNEQVGGCSGCSHCDPVDRECKPYGWGIESFEVDESARIRRHWRTMTTWGHPEPFADDLSQQLRVSLEWAGFDFAIRDKSDRVWDRICDTAKTHSQAVELYTRWARRATI